MSEWLTGVIIGLTGVAFGFGMALIIDGGTWQQPVGVLLISFSTTVLLVLLLRILSLIHRIEVRR